MLKLFVMESVSILAESLSSDFRRQQKKISRELGTISSKLNDIVSSGLGPELTAEEKSTLIKEIKKMKHVVTSLLEEDLEVDKLAVEYLRKCTSRLNYASMLEDIQNRANKTEAIITESPSESDIVSKYRHKKIKTTLLCTDYLFRKGHADCVATLLGDTEGKGNSEEPMSENEKNIFSVIKDLVDDEPYKEACVLELLLRSAPITAMSNPVSSAPTTFTANSSKSKSASTCSLADSRPSTHTETAWFGNNSSNGGTNSSAASYGDSALHTDVSLGRYSMGSPPAFQVSPLGSPVLADSSSAMQIDGDKIPTPHQHRLSEQGQAVKESNYENSLLQALTWCVRHGSRLRRLISPLEFVLRTEIFLLMIHSGRRTEAYTYIQEAMSPLVTDAVNRENEIEAELILLLANGNDEQTDDSPTSFSNVGPGTEQASEWLRKSGGSSKFANQATPVRRARSGSTSSAASGSGSVGSGRSNR